MRAVLCVSVHDVAPATWPDCERVIAALRAVADVPLTLLVVPHWHRAPEAAGARAACLGALDRMLADGHELALHGYAHLDEGPSPRGWRERLLRRVLTRREGEFAALDEATARARLAEGIAWFAARQWPLAGFVPPAWMMSEGALCALRASGLSWTTRFGGLVPLPQGAPLRAPALVYSARQPVGDAAVRACLSLAAVAQARSPLVRLCLHAADARRPANLRHAQRLLGRLLLSREAITKKECAARLRLGLLPGEPSAMGL